MIYRLIIFLIINFAALAIGGYFTGSAVTEEWYMGLDKAPWTPPGWVFGFAWTLIMICFSIYLAYLWPVVKERKSLIILFAIQWILNVGWNPAFFYFQHVLLISCLTILVGIFIFRYKKVLKTKSILLLPYILWLLIATSLNAYILLNN